jgi:adenine/guanine phosphoribosyltransferase-like PRPP-binding protein
VGELVDKLGATMLEYAFIMELTFLEGWKQLNFPAWRIVTEEEDCKAGYCKAP